MKAGLYFFSKDLFIYFYSPLLSKLSLGGQASRGCALGAVAGFRLWRRLFSPPRGNGHLGPGRAVGRGATAVRSARARQHSRASAARCAGKRALHPLAGGEVWASPPYRTSPVSLLTGTQTRRFTHTRLLSPSPGHALSQRRAGPRSWNVPSPVLVLFSTPLTPLPLAPIHDLVYSDLYIQNLS